MTRRSRGEPDLPPGPGRDLVDLFRRLRLVHGVTNGQVASRTRRSPGHISDVFAGWKAPRPGTAAELALALRGTDADARQARLLAERLVELNRHQRRHEKSGPMPAADPSLCFRLLGPVRVTHRGNPVDVGGVTARAMLAALLIRGPVGVGIDELVSWIWTGPDATTRDNVYRYVSNLRTALHRIPGVRLENSQQRYRITVDPDTVDWHRFGRLTEQASERRDAGEISDAARMLREALDLWDGAALSGIGDRLQPFRRRMGERRRAAIETLADLEAARQRPEAVLALLMGDLTDGPIREHAAALVIDAFTTLGQRDAAGAIYRQVRNRLDDEQGMEPSTELTRAHLRSLSGTSTVPAVDTAMPPISGLPPADPHFTGRVHALRRVVDVLTGPAAARLCVVSGMGGAGKTALAVQAARAASARFPDGTVFLDLHGYTRGRDPIAVTDALDRLMRRLRVDGRAIPEDLDERTALYRDRLADRRMLIVLDNARDADQVRPLLPGGGRCGVIVTSRRRLASLDEAATVTLDILDHAEALTLFRTVAGAERLRDEPAAGAILSRIVDSCGRLPLAVRIVASRFRARDAQRLTDLEAELSDIHRTLRGLDDGERGVAATLQTSITDLPDGWASTFAILAEHPGSDLDTYAATALTGLPAPEATRRLGGLADRHLLLQPEPGRYRFHDLVAAYAREQPTDPGTRAAALHRLADFYLRSAERADTLITPHRYRIPITPVQPDLALPELPDYDAALAWLNVEQHNLADTCIAAGTAGLDVSCWQLAYTLRGYYYLTKSWQPWTRTHEAALGATRRAGDRHAEAMVLNDLGLVYLEQNRTTDAAEHYTRARELARAAGDPHGETTARANLAWLAFADNRFGDFLTEIRPTMAFYRRTGAERNAAISLRGIGLAEIELGHIPDAIEDLTAALEVFVRLDLRLDTVMSWNAIGEAHQRAGDRTRARDAFTEAIAAADASGTIYERARARYRLGELASADGDTATARTQWHLALADYHQIGAAQADTVREAIARLPA